MNDELFLKQLEQIVPQDNSSRPVYAPQDRGDVYQTLHARTWSSERTQHIVWELPAEPRFQVSRGGVQRDWQLARQVTANLTLLALFIFTLIFWPHFRPHTASSSLPPSVSGPQFARTAAPTVYRLNLYGSQPASHSSTGFWPATRALPTRPSLYADNPVQNYAFQRASFPLRLITPYRAASYRIAPAAPVTGSIPPLQSPY